MTVKAILEAKGHDVFTLGPNEKLSEAVRVLAENRIGALVVTNGDRKIVGILSERDIVRAISRSGPQALDDTVRSAMTPKVSICNENHTVNEVMEIMTRGRFRHLPVEKNGLLDGIVSIGDVVKRRIEDVEREAE
ncbi:MAG: CBS domain-containing protein, partial [Hyphomicrobiales bacterium]|nr:CBS domain-containing protein [Hyphomicrobiales bacterium]